VISYSEEPISGEFILESIALEDVGAVEAQFSDEFITDTDLWVWPAEGLEPEEGIYLWLSNEDGGDHLFVHDLVRQARAAGAAVDFVEFSGAVEPRDLVEVEGAVQTGD